MPCLNTSRLWIFPHDCNSFSKNFALINMFFRNNSWFFIWRFIAHLFDLVLLYFWRSSDDNSAGKVPIFGDNCIKSDEDTGENTKIIQYNPTGLESEEGEMYATLLLLSKSDENSGENDGSILGCDHFQRKEMPRLEKEEETLCSVESNTSKYEVFASNVCSFIEEPQIMNFTVHEMFVVSCHESLPNQDSLKKDCHSFKFESSSFEQNDCDVLRGEDEVAKEKESKRSNFDLIYEEQDLENSICDVSGEDEKIEIEQIVDQEEYNIVEKIEEFDKPKLSISNSDDFWASIYTYDGFSSTNEKFDSNVDDLDPLKTTCMIDTTMDCDQEIHANVDFDIEIEHEGVESPYIVLEPMSMDVTTDFENSQSDQEKTTTQFSFTDVGSGECDQETTTTQFSFTNVGSGESDQETTTIQFNFTNVGSSESDQENVNRCGLKDLNGSKNFELEDMETSDVIIEQKELIRQMRREIRQLKISGLPTILEESESPRVEEDLRPLNIDEKIGYKDLMGEIQTFYRKYHDKMKKLDILSQQTLYAIDLTFNKTASIHVNKSFQTHTVRSSNLKNHKQNSHLKSIKDLQRDLELSYVGQLCLTWEILKWQHNKAKELQFHDPNGFHQHNKTAGEFQKFQVLLHRFIEDEPYHRGTRVQQFVYTRSCLPALLRVPLIQVDPKPEQRRDTEDEISVKMLREFIGSSMHSFWEFLHADKLQVSTIPLMGFHGVQTTLQDPSDSGLVTEIRSCLQKKERRLKDLIRSGNCLMKIFQKRQDQKLSHEMMVAQVELRLVSRVLSMQRLNTDQLLWCHKKLNNVDIIGRNIYLDSSFLPLPC